VTVYYTASALRANTLISLPFYAREAGSRTLRQWNDECFAATDGQGKML